MRDPRIEAAVATFPVKFGLQAFPGEEFSILPQDSYINDAGQVVLYLGRWCRPAVAGCSGHCLAFSKSTVPELRAAIVEA